MRVTISAKWMQVRFEGCSPDYITTTCHGRCCDPKKGTNHPADVRPWIAVTEREQTNLLLNYPWVRIENDMLRPRMGEGKCSFQQSEGFCGLHFTEHKPIGCWSSPFTLNANNKLILRKRYTALSCHVKFKETGLPAYKAFSSSLVKLFGENESRRITEYLDNGGTDDIEADMIDWVYDAHSTMNATLAQMKAK